MKRHRQLITCGRTTRTAVNVMGCASTYSDNCDDDRVSECCTPVLSPAEKLELERELEKIINWHALPHSGQFRECVGFYLNCFSVCPRLKKANKEALHGSLSCASSVAVTRRSRTGSLPQHELRRFFSCRVVRVTTSYCFILWPAKDTRHSQATVRHLPPAVPVTPCLQGPAPPASASRRPLAVQCCRR